jgi:hypothetical protein
MKLGIEGISLNKDYIQQSYRQHHTKWEKLKPFPLKSGTTQGCPLFPLFGIPRQNNKTGGRKKEFN